MAPDSPNLDRVRVQAARMLEIYALLQGELDGGGIRIPPAQREQLTQAIRTIAGNMQELQAYLAVAREDSSGTPAESTPTPISRDGTRSKTGAAGVPPSGDADLDDLMETVLKWVTESEGGG